MQRIYIDANAAIGRTNFREPEIPYKTESLLNEMEYCRIHAAMVFSQTARDYSFTAGNHEALEAAKVHGRLFAVAAVLPDMKYELDDAPAYLEMLAKGGAHAFKLFPASFSHEFSPFTLEDLAGFMIEKELPLLVDQGQVSFENLRTVLQAFPSLNVLLCGSHWGVNRDLFRLMEKFSNLHFEISTNQANNILEVCKRHFGVKRVLFGTGYPHKSPGALKSLVEYARLDEADKDAVAAGNALRLFRIDPDSLARYDEGTCRLDGIARRVDCGLPLSDELVIDAHGHMVEREHRAVATPPMFGADEDNIVEKLNLLGVDAVIVSPWEGLATAEHGNETMLRAHERYPDRIMGYATWNPSYPEDLDGVISLYHERYRFPGLKPYHPYHQSDLLDARYDRWFEYGSRHGLIMLVHVERPEIADKVDVLAQKYPDMSFLLAHSGQSYRIARGNAAVAWARANVFLEITYSSLTYGVIEYLVREAGADKVIYGTDFPMRDPAPQLAWVCYAKISEEDKRKILGGNIKKLLGRCYAI